MSRLTKRQSLLHTKACTLLQKDVLTFDERLFVLENWQESANHLNGLSGAFFTPPGLARNFSIEVSGRTLIDLCAGIGSLAFAAYHYNGLNSSAPDKITCVDINPDYVAVGRKVLPEATWIVANVLDLPESLTGFDYAIANPPFGRIKHVNSSPRYTGNEFEYKVIDVASDLAEYGVFLIPQSSSPFRLSGIRGHEETLTAKYTRFSQQTAIELEANCGIDTTFFQDEWHGVSIVTEIALADFTVARERRRPEENVAGNDADSAVEQMSLFAAA